MKTIRAKFKVIGIDRAMGSAPNGKGGYSPAEIQSVKLRPVYGNGDAQHENTKFWNATPSGEIRLDCVNLAAASAFKLDCEYYVDFSPADESDSPASTPG